MYIKKIILENFKRYKKLEMPFNKDINIFVGDNESGKSTILQAIDLVVRGSISKVEEFGVDKLMNIDAVNQFITGEHKYENLPEIFIELYLSEDCEDLAGKTNSQQIIVPGIRLYCRPNEKFSKEIMKAIEVDGCGIPFDFYEIGFETFAGVSYARRSKFLKALLVDNANIGNPYVMNEFVHGLFDVSFDPVKQVELRQKYRSHKDRFVADVLKDYQLEDSNYAFSLKNTPRNNIESDLAISDNGIALENKGAGIQCFIKTDLALSKNENIDVIMLEEPENHLSYTNTLKLIEKIKKSSNQLFVASHSDLICTRLDLRKCFLMNSSAAQYVSLNGIPEDTANFFIKAPDNKMLQFVLSSKIVLVEGDAEYIMMEKMFRITTGKSLKEAGVGVISVNGLCFKRYLDIAKIIGMKVVVITDNDKDYQTKIIDKYDGYTNDNLKIFADSSDERYTFEVCIYKDNEVFCDSKFAADRKTLSVQEYMLSNKADVAFVLAKCADDIIVPRYIKDALNWISA